MNISFSLESLIDLTGFIIGLTFGLGVIIHHWKKKSFLYLGLFIIVYSMGFVPAIVETALSDSIFKEVLLSISFSWLLYPLFYIYIQHISSLEVKEVKFPLIIGLLGVITEFCIKVFVGQNIDAETSFLLSKILFTFEFFISVYFGIKTYLWIQIQRKEVHNHFSNVIDKELNWSLTFLLIGLSFTFLGGILMMFDIYYVAFFYIFPLVNVSLLIWISFKSVFQNQIDKIETGNKSQPKEKPKESQEENLEDDIKANEVVKTINDYIKNSKCYIHSELTISDLSNLTGIHTKKISGCINTILNTNFNSYINSFRIQAAKEKLLNYDSSKLSIEGIGKDVGFKSKSTFYRAFKKETGVTPKEFVNNN